MYKGSIELGRINKDMKLKFIVYLKEDINQYNISQLNGREPKVVERFSYGSDDYLRVTPNAQVVIDIQKTDGYDPNNIISMSKRNLFQFRRNLKKFIHYFEEDDLFYYEDGNLKINKELSNKYMTVTKTFTKSIALQHSVVTDQNNNIEYEGCIFMINSRANYAYLTYEDLIFLQDELEKIDLSKLAMNVILLNMSLNIFEELNGSAKKIALQRLVNEQKSDIDQGTKVPIPMEKSELETMNLGGYNI